MHTRFFLICFDGGPAAIFQDARCLAAIVLGQPGRSDDHTVFLPVVAKKDKPLQQSRVTGWRGARRRCLLPLSDALFGRSPNKGTESREHLSGGFIDGPNDLGAVKEQMGYFHHLRPTRWAWLSRI